MNAPEVHAVQAAMPGDGAIVPAMHGTHVVFETASWLDEDVPAGHLAHWLPRRNEPFPQAVGESQYSTSHMRAAGSDRSTREASYRSVPPQLGVVCWPPRYTTNAVPFAGCPERIPLPRTGSLRAHCEPYGHVSKAVQRPEAER